uniref:CCHC-type domain-containing protein n=1 Tax=Ananas comosus var. bracteatus TaxID=296719 RepID=A0A6V7NHL5_ANACO|nr:unnamed protein product [Ananas comosus var. bracteatus]
MAAVPVARPAPAVVATGSGTSNPDGAAMAAERDRVLAALVMFRKFDPLVFDGEKVEPWMVELWIDSMKTLFEDLYTLEKDKSIPRHSLLGAGDEGVIIENSTYYRDDKDRADWFEQGLRPDIYKAVHILKLTTFAEVLDRALWAEHGNAYVREEREVSEKDGGKKWAPGGSGGQSKSKSRKPPKYPWTQSWGRGVQQCVICGGDHRAMHCEQRQGKCFECGQAGHVSHYCPRKTSPAPSVALAPTTPGHYGGAPLAAVSAGRAMAPRQPEMTRSARVDSCLPLKPRNLSRLRSATSWQVWCQAPRLPIWSVRARRTDAERTEPPLSVQG